MSEAPERGLAYTIQPRLECRRMSGGTIDASRENAFELRVDHCLHLPNL
jgi:hypothetical protein